MTKEEIKEEFLKGYDCSQVVLRAFAKELQITEDEANRMAACFGGGMLLGETCGVITGALIAIGLKYGHSQEENILQQKDVMMQKSTAFKTEFLKSHPSLICKELLGYDVSKPEELEEVLANGRMLDLCPGLAKEAIDILKELGV